MQESPSSVSVNIDYGVSGNRGSKILLALGDPNDSETVFSGLDGDTFQEYDLCTNVIESDTDYLGIYQYRNIDQENPWQFLLKIVPNNFGANVPVTFVDGYAGNVPGYNFILIPVNVISNDPLLTPNNFNLQFSIQSETPLQLAFDVQDSYVNILGIDYLAVAVFALEYISDSWSPVMGQRVLHGYITVV